MKIHIAIAGLPEALVFSVVPGVDPDELATACGAAIEGEFATLRAMGNVFVGAIVIYWPSVRAVWFTDESAEAASDAEGWTVVTEDESTWPPAGRMVEFVDGSDGFVYTPDDDWGALVLDASADGYIGDRWRLTREGE
tara:strand:- start:62 stop:475 length:414 start_codon:yes stop_codon:yes gene_type:complete